MVNAGLVDTLKLLGQGIGVGAVIAFLFERMTWFQSLPTNARWWLILGVSLLLPLGAQLALQLVPPSIWATIEPYWQSLVAGFMIWAGAQGAHLFEKKARA